MTMKNSYSKLFFFLCTIFILVRISIAQQQQQLPDFLYNFCINNGNFTDNSTYQTNLQTLLSNISSNTQIDYGFYNSSFGLKSDRVNAIALCRGDVSPDNCRSCIKSSAIALCRGDVSPDNCRSCIKSSTQKLTQICPYYKEAIGWYDSCMLRYTNRSNIFRTREDFPAFYMWNLNNVSNANQFNKALENLMFDLRNKAALGDSRRKFATEKVKGGSFKNIYGFVQCTPDLSELQCGSCLDGAISQIPNCCDKKHGGRYIRPSCNIRYEVDQFYESSPPSPPTSRSS